MNDAIVAGKHQSCSILRKNNAFFVCVSEVTNNTCGWLNIVNSHYSKPEANQN